MTEVVLAVAICASVLVVWWLMRKFIKLAFYAGLLGAGAWWWYFGTPSGWGL